MHFYCQLDFADIPYPSPSSPNGNLADNGCGVCAACMVIEALTGRDYTPNEGAALAIASGAREGFGTDMSIFAPAFAERFGLKCKATQNTDEVKRFLEQAKGLCIANTVGDREGWKGVFSDSRHYIVLRSVENGTVAVWDPMLSPGRYECEGRAGKVRLEGYTAFADFRVVENDCCDRPYYLIWTGTDEA